MHPLLLLGLTRGRRINDQAPAACRKLRSTRISNCIPIDRSRGFFYSRGLARIFSPTLLPRVIPVSPPPPRVAVEARATASEWSRIIRCICDERCGRRRREGVTDIEDFKPLSQRWPACWTRKILGRLLSGRDKVVNAAGKNSSPRIIQSSLKLKPRMMGYLWLMTVAIHSSTITANVQQTPHPFENLIRYLN